MSNTHKFENVAPFGFLKVTYETFDYGNSLRVCLETNKGKLFLDLGYMYELDKPDPYEERFEED